MGKILTGIAVLFVLGCASGFEQDLSHYKFVTGGNDAKQDVSGELRQVAEEARPLINNLLDCINPNPVKDIFINYEKRYIKYFNEPMRNAFRDPEKVRKINQRRRSKIGKYLSCELGRIQKRFDNYALIYKVTCTGQKGTGAIRMSVKRNREDRLEITYLTFLPFK